MNISKLLDGIKTFEFVIPEFQREYVWSLEQAKQLMVSLFREYPTGSLLFWETTNPPEIKNDAVNKDKMGLTKVILDGQQRLTTLYLLITGEIPPYYTEGDLVNNPRHLYFNLLTGEFLYYMKSKMENSYYWKRVTNCFNKDFNAFTVIGSLDFEDSSEKLKTGEIINNNLNKLKGILHNDYPIQTIPSNSGIDEAIDVFDRVNSKGTKLTDAELVLTHVTGKWHEARRELKKKLDQLKKVGFIFELDFLTRCFVVSLTNSAKFKSVNYENYNKGDYIESWKQVSKALDYLIPVLRETALIGGTDNMSTPNALIPIIAYFLTHDGKFTEEKKHGFLYWMFLAMVWQRYSGQTDQRLDKDVYIAINSLNPITELVGEIEDQRGRIKITPSDMEGRGASNPIYKLLYIITKNKKAIDWANGGSISETLGDYFSIQSHHIFPQSFLYKNGFDPNSHIDKKMVNAIANRAFITRDTNFAISAKDPAVYLNEIEAQFPSALEKQFIPMNKELWKVENYTEFLSERRKLIAKEINRFLQELKNKSGKEEPAIDWNEIVEKGENDFVEFKSSIRWDYATEQVNKTLEHSIAKTIAAFLNSEGGRLFIGIDDNGSILGIDKDKSTLKKQNNDAFLQHMVNLINNYLGKEYHQYIGISIMVINEKEICIVEVNNSGNPVFLNHQGKEEFFFRASATTQALGIKEAMDYIGSHWD